jgi:hypothetical protein
MPKPKRPVPSWSDTFPSLGRDRFLNATTFPVRLQFVGRLYTHPGDVTVSNSNQIKIPAAPCVPSPFREVLQNRDMSPAFIFVFVFIFEG